MSADGTAVGSGRSARLDPFGLPVRFKTGDAGADDRERIIELGRERVVMRRAVRGIPMRVVTPVSKFRGVALRVVPPEGDFDGAVAVILEHDDPGLSVPLHVAAGGEDAAVEMQTWSRLLGVPVLVKDDEGRWRDPSGPLGRLRAGRAMPRRRGRTLKYRRSLRRLRRKPGAPPATPAIHRGEREIIARN